MMEKMEISKYKMAVFSNLTIIQRKKCLGIDKTYYKNKYIILKENSLREWDSKMVK